MMTIATYGVALHGIDGLLVSVEISRQDGLPGVDVVGLPAASVKESRHRVKAALKAGGYEWPPDRLIVNFAPADLPKDGTALDLPLAVAVLALFGVLPSGITRQAVYFGELGLDGSIRPVPGAVSAALAAREHGINTLFVAPEMAAEAAAVSEVTVYAVRSLVELVEFLLGRLFLDPAEAEFPELQPQAHLDMVQIRGQALARRALEIAAAGKHNLLFIGPPGCGKTLLARALPGILPPLSLEESLDVTRIHSVSGLSHGRGALLRHPPFRAPHATSSQPALVGGGSPPVPGEVSLAHHGVLFLDEAAEFRRATLDALRAPVEDRWVHIARARRSVSFPSSVMLVLATNPCPCGNYGNPKQRCRCTPAQVRAYQHRLSGPLLDRIDLHVALRPVSPQALSGLAAGESSADVQARVMKARAIQTARNGAASDGAEVANSGLCLRELARVAALGDEENRFLTHAGESLGISARSWHRVIRVARTIADLEGVAEVGVPHLAEALSLRRGLLEILSVAA